MRAVDRLRSDSCGQSTVEYVLVLAGFAAVLAGLGALSSQFQDGWFVDAAVRFASHHVGGDPVGAALDVVLF